MSDEEEQDCPECPPGLPAYLATFADLMSLLMCFFVLLLAFSEMDAQKYKQVAGSMKAAFGVQLEVKGKDTPKGTSIIAKEFSPGRPDPTILNVVQQKTIDNLKNTLDVLCAEGQSEDAENASDEKAKQEQAAKMMQKLIAQTQADAVKIASMMKADIMDGKVEVETKGRKIVIRVKENGSFASGSATLRPSFVPIMDKVRAAIKDMPGEFSVNGHTDDVPISTARFRSNWELSSARAVSVAHELMKTGEMDPNLFVVVGHGETKPRVANDSNDNRSTNRRVEIVVEQGTRDELILSGEEELPEDDEFNEEMLKEAGLEGLEGFSILSDTQPEEEKKPEEGDREISAFDPPPAPNIADEFESITLEDEPAPAAQPKPVEPKPPAPRREEVPPSGNAFDITVDPFKDPAPPSDDEFF